ncbi:hypothetical protein [Streptomyces sp. NPDC054786]
MKRGGPARWNNETQRWEDGTPPPAPYTGPPPPRPSFAPTTGVPSTDGPLPAPAPPAEPLPGVRQRATALVAGAAVAVIAAAVGGGYLLWGHPGDAPAAARPPVGSKASAAPSTATTVPTGSTQPTATDPSAGGLPDGYRLVHDAKGFTIAVPEGWQRSEEENGVFYTASDDRGLVQIFEVSEPDSTPRQALQKASQERSAQPGFEEISLAPMGGPAPGTDAAQLVYAYDSKRLGARVKVVDCAFTAADGRLFAVLVLGTEADWPQQERTQQIALQAFAPTT